MRVGQQRLDAYLLRPCCRKFNNGGTASSLTFTGCALPLLPPPAPSQLPLPPPLLLLPPLRPLLPPPSRLLLPVPSALAGLPTHHCSTHNVCGWLGSTNKKNPPLCRMGSDCASRSLTLRWLPAHACLRPAWGTFFLGGAESRATGLEGNLGCQRSEPAQGARRPALHAASSPPRLAPALRLTAACRPPARPLVPSPARHAANLSTFAATGTPSAFPPVGAIFSVAVSLPAGGCIASVLVGSRGEPAQVSAAAPWPEPKAHLQCCAAPVSRHRLHRLHASVCRAPRPLCPMKPCAQCGRLCSARRSPGTFVPAPLTQPPSTLTGAASSYT